MIIEEENGNCREIFLVLYYSKNLFIFLRYFFIVEFVLEVSKELNNELKFGLIVGGSIIYVLFVNMICKKKLYY